MNEENKLELDGQDNVSDSSSNNDTMGSPKKMKKKMTKKAKIIMWTAITLVVAIVVGIGSWLIVLMTDKYSPAVNADNLVIFMDKTHYVGTNGTVDVSLAFPSKVVTLPNTDKASLAGTILSVTGAGNFKLNVGEDEYTVTIVADGYNVSKYDDMFKKISESKKVVIQVPRLEMTEAKGTISLMNDLYGNGCKLIAYEVAKPEHPTEKGKGGDTAISISVTDKIILRDIHVLGRDLQEGDDIKSFNNYGSMLNIEVSPRNGVDKANVDVIHCIFENSHKVVHIVNANVNMEGTIVRNASDTAVSIGTYKNAKVTLNSKNNVIANSLTGGITIYGLDGEINATTDGSKTWNVINIEGFLDIYNWISTDKITILPDTEVGGAIGNIANSVIRSEITPKDKHTDKKVTIDDKQYIHFGILKIFTGGNYPTNDSIVNGMDKIGYKSEKLPIPPAATGLMKDCVVAGYYTNNSDSVRIGKSISDNLKLYSELIYGRK